MPLHFGEIVLIRMQFHQSAGAKVRPAPILLDTEDDDFVAAPITSRLRSSAFDFAIAEWRSAGLNTISSVRIHKLTVLPKTDLIRVIGVLAQEDRERFAEMVCKAFCPEA